MSDLAFPTLVSSNWRLTRSPTFVTKVQLSASGLRSAAAFRSTPLWSWRLKNGVLQSDTTIADLQAIEEFINTLEGMYDSFLWSDSEVTSFAGTYPTRVALLKDSHEFERFAPRLWRLGEISFQLVTA